MILGITTLLIALLISTVSAWYSILGLTAIFAGAVMPAVIMGISLELGKVMVAVWLHQNWKRDRLLKFYLIPALIFLMMLTSVGVFGFLSKAHVDQNLVSGDVIAEIAIFDEKIRTERENIDVNRKQLKQMDEAVDQVMGRSSDEKGAERAVTIRRSQQKERGRLLAEITESQKRISALNEERAPIAAKVRKVEAEVGPIKYVAALFSTNTPDQDQLERAVRWVIILIVIVFDPLAIVLIIAGISQLGWSKPRGSNSGQTAWSPSGSDGGLVTIDDMIVGIKPDNVHPAYTETKPKPFNSEPFISTTISQYKSEDEPEEEISTEEQEQSNTELERARQDREILAEYVQQQDQTIRKRTQELVQVREILTDLHNDQSNLSELNLRSMQREQDLQSELAQTRELLAEAQAERDRLFLAYSAEMTRANELAQEVANQPYTEPEEFFNQALTVAQAIDTDTYTAPVIPARQPAADFGDSFPNTPSRGDMFLRTDFKPSRLFKWNDVKWIEVNKNTTDVYNYNDAYLQFLVEKISTGEYSTDDLSYTEQQQVRTMLGSR